MNDSIGARAVRPRLAQPPSLCVRNQDFARGRVADCAATAALFGREAA
jgi:hypothetical protein